MPGVDEGMNGLPPASPLRSCLGCLTSTMFEVAANPVHLFYVLEQQIEREQFPQEQAERYLEFLKGYLIPKYAEFIGKEIRPPIWNPTPSMGRTFSIAMSPTLTSGSGIRNTAIRTPGSCLTVNR